MSLSARRAWIEILMMCQSVERLRVALRKESVDRNEWIKAQYPGCRVALRKESVDRNNLGGQDITIKDPSLSARRAWIEMDWASVINAMTSQSLSARRAWIEIHRLIHHQLMYRRRSPQGERG